MAQLLLSSCIGSLSWQQKVEIFTILGWIDRLQYFDSKALAALNLEELNSIEEEKQIFLNKIGYDDKILNNILIFGKKFNPIIEDQTTEEGLRFLMNEMAEQFSIENPNFRLDVLQTAVEKYLLENKHTALPSEKIFPPEVRCLFPEYPPHLEI